MIESRRAPLLQSFLVRSGHEKEEGRSEKRRGGLEGEKGEKKKGEIDG